jgi:ribonuclease D
MIQLNNGINTFLIDIYRMDLNGDVETFELTKKVLRNVMMDKGILKIFHDCRHDSLALHEFMNCCVNNIFDTSASETYRGQL